MIKKIEMTEDNLYLNNFQAYGKAVGFFMVRIIHLKHTYINKNWL